MTTTNATTLYEKCADCHLFVEKNDDYQPDSGIAEYAHLHRGDEADEELDGSHEARPSGMKANLPAWKEFGPPAMLKRFWEAEPRSYLLTDAEGGAVLTIHPSEQDALDTLRENFASDDE